MNFIVEQQQYLLRGEMWIIFSEASARKSSWNMGYSVKLLCGTQLLQLVNHADGPSLEVKGKCEKINTEQVYERNKNVHWQSLKKLSVEISCT